MPCRLVLLSYRRKRPSYLKTYVVMQRSSLSPSLDAVVISQSFIRLPEQQPYLGEAIPVASPLFFLS